MRDKKIFRTEDPFYLQVKRFVPLQLLSIFICIYLTSYYILYYSQSIIQRSPEFVTIEGNINRSISL